MVTGGAVYIVFWDLLHFLSIGDVNCVAAVNYVYLVI